MRLTRSVPKIRKAVTISEERKLPSQGSWTVMERAARYSSHESSLLLGWSCHGAAALNCDIFYLFYLSDNILLWLWEWTNLCSPLLSFFHPFFYPSFIFFKKKTYYSCLDIYLFSFISPFPLPSFPLKEASFVFIFGENICMCFFEIINCMLMLLLT